MNKAPFATLLFCTFSSTQLVAGGMDRTSLAISALFEQGTYIELSALNFDHDVSGTLPANNTSSDDIYPSFWQFALAYKQDLNDAFSMAVFIDSPYGADVAYPNDTGYAFAGSTATVETVSVTGVLRYKINEPFSIYGGARYIRSKGEVDLPFATYSLRTDNQYDWGYLVGMSVEKKDIGLRASLTYHSAIDVDFNNDETIVAASLSNRSSLVVKIPQSLNFDFQTGITDSTLLLFSARWAEWAETEITPELFTTYISPGNNLVDYSQDTISYSLGIGQRLSNDISASLAVGYESGSGEIQRNLAPVDGYTSLGAGLKYAVSEQTQIAVGVKYYWIGDTHTRIGANRTDFQDNDSVVFGMKLSYSL